MSAPFVDPIRYGRRLAIVVPYRNRPEHLGQFIPHMLNYFERDKLDRHIDVTINIIEQAGDAPFNRGKLNNTGFALLRETSDYACFHDVDYLPIWADYSWSPAPARLIWHGLTLQEDWENFFGAVELFDNAAFTAVNGFPNCYWGWGPEDLELGLRCRILGRAFEKRDGTYMPLKHQHAGFAAQGVWTEEARKTHEVFEARKQNFQHHMQTDGLNDLTFKLVSKDNISVNGAPNLRCWRWLVDIGS